MELLKKHSGRRSVLKRRNGGKVSSDDEKVEKIYFLIGKAYEETGAGYLLISFSYEQTAAAYEKIEIFDFFPLENKKPLPFHREGPFASDLL